MRDLQWQYNAWAEYLELQTNRLLAKKVNMVLKDILRNGYQTSYGRLEMLKGDLSGYASVRIDQKNRVVFKADQYRVLVIQCGSHYRDH